MTDMNLQEFRREYLSGQLQEEEMPGDPHLQFLAWLEDAIRSGIPDPTAMSLATADVKGKPSVRILLLKEARASGLLFFSSYDSRKGKELKENPQASMMFFWPGLERQIRIEGRIERLAAKESDAFFESRPLESRIATTILPQSRVISGRDTLQHQFERLRSSLDGNTPKRPESWGGYILKPGSYEFWQGREHRLNDRLEYYRKNGSWEIRRLAP